MHCKKSIKRNEAETSVGLIFQKSLFATHNINKYPEFRAITISTDDILIINIYISAQENLFRTEQFEWLQIKRYKAKNKGKEVIIMGDMNSLQNETLDRMSNVPRESEINCKHINSLLNTGMIDTFRHLHGEKRKFTRFAVSKIMKNNNEIDKHISTRIDYIFVSQNLEDNLISAKIYETRRIMSDHRIVAIKINWMPKLNITHNKKQHNKLDVGKFKNKENVEEFNN